MKTLKTIGLICAGLIMLLSFGAFAAGEIAPGLVIFIISAGFALVIWHSKPPEKGWAKKAAADNRAAFQAIADEQLSKKQAIRARIAAAEAAGEAYCPKCGSTSLTANKKGYGIGKGVIGAAVAGPIGLAAGNLGRQKVLVTCLNCGYQFKPGKK